MMDDEKEYGLEIAETILRQMGGRTKLTVFTGCEIQTGYGQVEISVPKPAKNYCKMVVIKYNWSTDLYDIKGYSSRGKLLEDLTEVYAEDLVRTFEKMTGYFLGNIYIVGI